MGSFIIQGGRRLNGEITPQGAKNEALQVLCAVLLTQEEVTLYQVPQIQDVLVSIKLLENLGVIVKKLSKNSYVFKAEKINEDFLISNEFREQAAKIRGSVMLVGPLLGRLNKVTLPKLGGDKIGRRNINVHLEGLENLGAKVTYQTTQKEFLFEIEDRLQGKPIHLREASVTGTGNLIMAAVLAQGTTTIYNAACEPYVQQLCQMLVSMGAQIKGIGSNLLTIDGVDKLSGCVHKIAPDMIEIGSWIGLAAVTHSELLIRNVKPKHIGILTEVFAEIGVKTEFTEEGLLVPHQPSYHIKEGLDGSIPTISDAPWPGLSPDMISVLLVVAVKAYGCLMIHQKMFESRLFFTDKLIEMGARIILCDPHRAVVIGLGEKYSLRATTMTSPDIRAGVSLLIAALAAKGTSTIQNIEQIDRGYEEIDLKLNQLGAKITRL